MTETIERLFVTGPAQGGTNIKSLQGQNAAWRLARRPLGKAGKFVAQPLMTFITVIARMPQEPY